jgi:hypothetical protein
MMFGTFIAGVSFADDLAHIAVLQVKKESLTLRYLGEYARTSPAEFWFLDQLLAGTDRMLRRVSRASVAADHGTAFVHCFPTDNSLNSSDEQDQINWELSNFIPSFKADDYTREKHVLQTHAHRQYSELMVVAFKRSFVQSTEASLRKKQIALAKVESNHFGAQHALLLNNPEIKPKMVGVVHLMQKRLDVGMINRGRLIHYRSVRVAPEVVVPEILRADLNSFPASDLFFHGAWATDAIVDRARAELPCRVAKLNPFRGMQVASSFREFDSYIGKEHRFAAAVGSALRCR